MPPVDRLFTATFSGTWMLTSTVRSSSLASIIRTGTFPPTSARISVCPGYTWPARFIAALLSGAVTTARTLPAIASCAARYTAWKAASPPAAETCPTGRSSGTLVTGTTSRKPVFSPRRLATASIHLGQP